VASGGVTLAGIFLLGILSWRRRWGKLLSFAVLAFLVSAVGCGGGGSGPPPPPPNLGTLPGTYTVAVTATSGALTHSISLTLNVQ